MVLSFAQFIVDTHRLARDNNRLLIPSRIDVKHRISLMSAVEHFAHRTTEHMSSVESKRQSFSYENRSRLRQMMSQNKCYDLMPHTDRAETLCIFNQNSLDYYVIAKHSVFGIWLYRKRDSSTSTQKRMNRKKKRTNRRVTNTHTHTKRARVFRR